MDPEISRVTESVRASTAVLHDGRLMPRLGLGVYGLAGGQCARAVEQALSMGYRLIDTARFYCNESDVGRAVRESAIPREHVFVTTKLWDDDQGFDRAIKACDESLARLGMDYVDLYLIHWPTRGVRLESWRGLIELQKQGKCRSIGVSNFTISHLKELLAHFDVVPAVNQVEFSPFCFQRALLMFCRDAGIQLEAYGSLTRGAKLGHPAVSELALKHRKSAAQILLRWAVQHEVVIIPKSGNRERIESNASIFDFALDDQDMSALDALNVGYRTSRDPTSVV